LAEKYQWDERLVFLDAVCALARGRLEAVHTLNAGLKVPKAESFYAMLLGFRPAIDWDVALRTSNPWYDRLVETVRKPAYAERKEALAKLYHDQRMLIDVVKSASPLDNIPSRDLGRVWGLLTASALIGTHLPATDCLWAGFIAACTFEDCQKTRRDIDCLAFALAAYRADRGDYPRQLSDLTPKYVQKLPKDIFAGEGDFHYARRGGGYLLYSVGPNGLDEGGMGRGDTDEAGNLGWWDDIAIRVGMEPKAPKTPAAVKSHSRKEAK
jgi:hypothetical protein